MAKRRDTGLFAGPMMPESRGYGQQANVLGGTMGAVVYGQNPAAQNLAGNLNAVRQAEQMRMAQQQADAQQMAQTWRDNELEAAEGMLWADQLGAVEQQHIATGQELMQEGINPYESMNPRAVAYRRQRRDILNQRAYRKGIESQYMKTLEEIRKDPNKYRPDDIQRLNEWISGTNLSDAYSQNQQLPMLRQRFDPSEALKGVRAVTTSTTDVKDGWKTERTQIDRPQTEGLILGQLINAPGGAEYLAELTGGLPVNEVLSVPDSRSDIVSALKEGYSGNPRIREQLAAQGIVGDKLVDEWANKEASRFLGAKNNLKSFLDRQVDAAASGVKLEEKRTRDTTEETLRLRYAQLGVSQGNLAQRVREYNDKLTDTKKKSEFAKDVSRQNPKSLEDFQISIEMNQGRLIPAGARMVDGVLTPEEPNTFIVTLPDETRRQEVTDPLTGETKLETVLSPREYRIKLDGTPASERQVSHILNMLKGVSTKDKDNTYEQESLESYFDDNDPLLDYFND